MIWRVAGFSTGRVRPDCAGTQAPPISMGRGARLLAVSITGAFIGCLSFLGSGPASRARPLGGGRRRGGLLPAPCDGGAAAPSPAAMAMSYWLSLMRTVRPEAVRSTLW